MKKSSFARILILVLSLALLIGSVMAITAMASEEARVGSFGNISVAYGDKVYIRVEVKATQAQIENKEVVVSYRFADEAEANVRPAIFYMNGDTEGYVWVITEGIAVFDMAREVVFSSTANGEQIEANRKYSVAQFIYKMLYTDSGISENYENLYEALLNYGEKAQIALNKNADKLITKSTLVTGAEGITFDGKDFAFASGASATVAPTLKDSTDNQPVIGWTIKENGTEKQVAATFTCSGIVEVLAPVYGEHVDTVKYEWADDYSYCKAYVDCDEHAASETVYIDKVALKVTATKVAYTYNAVFSNGEYAAQTKTVEADVALENSVATVNAPAIAGKVASHDYVKFDFHDAAATYDFTIYYSALSTWDGTSVSTSLSGAGTEASPYLIQSAADFAYLQTCESSGKYFKLTVSVDFNNNALSIASFAGILDGNNCSIRGINLTNTAELTGLFKVLEEGSQVSNLTLYGTVSGSTKTGALAGESKGKVINVTNYASVSGAGNLGGVIGHSTNKGYTEGCVNYGSVSGSAYNNGGVIGFAESNVVSCVNFGEVKTTSDCIGGVVGAAHSLVSSCVNYGNVTATKTNVGGIVFTSNSTVENCVNYGSVSGSGSAGGIMGMITENNTAVISNCINNGIIKAGYNSGGILGYSDKNTTVTLESCVNNADVAGTTDVGGILGGIQATCQSLTINSCTNNGAVSGSWGVAGIVGNTKDCANTVAKVTYCTNNGAVTGSGIVGGIASKFSGTVTNCTNTGVLKGTVSNTATGYVIGQLYNATGIDSTNKNDGGTGAYNDALVAEVK